jgi:hypothetical protein
LNLANKVQSKNNIPKTKNEHYAHVKSGKQGLGSSGQPVKLSESWNLEITDTDSYTSRHFRLRPGEVEQFLNSSSLAFKQAGDQVKVKYCPLCPKDHKNDPTNLFVLNIESNVGVFHCFR